MKKLVAIVVFTLVSTISAGHALALTASEEMKRQSLVAQELSKYRHKVLTYDASLLEASDKAFLRHMMNAAEIIEEINMLQLNPKNLEFKNEIEKKGTVGDKILFHRNQCPWCLDSEEFLCNALKSVSSKQIGWDFWPEGMDEKMLGKLKDQGNFHELLSPFTYVKKDKGDKYKAIPFASYPLLSDRLRKLSEELNQALPFVKDKSLKKFLRSRSKAFEEDSAFPYDKSDYDWIALKGPWEITVGPYETYKEPMKTKAQFEMYIAREDPLVGSQLKNIKKHIQDYENHFAKFIGPKLYKPRKLDSRIKIRAVELIYAAGDGRSPHGATVAYHLPNQGKAIEEGLYKKVLLVNHMKLFTPLMKKRARVSLVKEQVLLVDEWSDIMNTVFHELSHGFGAYETMKIKVDGKKTTIAQALGPLETLIEELKADVASLWFIPYLVEQGLMDKDEVKKRYITAVMHLFGLSQYSLKGTYAQMAAVELGNLMDHKALVYNPKTGLFKIDYEKFPQAVESLLKRIVNIQLTGNSTDAELLRAEYIRKNRDGTFSFQPVLLKPMAKLKRAFDRAQLKSFAIDYEVKGLATNDMRH